MQANDCALLLAIPIDRREFDADGEAATDFLRSYAAPRPGWNGERLWAAYAPLARLAAEVASEMARLGVHVIRRATASDFSRTAIDCSVVTLVAHSLGPDVRPSDVLDPFKVATSVTTIRDALGLPAHAAPAAPGAGDVETVAKWLNALIDFDLEAMTANPDAADIRRMSQLVHAYTIRWRRRRTVEGLVPGALAAGVGVEFADGFQSIESLDEMLPLELTGTIDFTVCESVLLGQTLRARRAGGVILSNADLTSADFRIALYRQTVSFMLRRGIPYSQAALKLRSHLRGTLCCH